MANHPVMQSLENLDEQIKDAILVNGGDINIADYPYIIKEAEEHGISGAELARRIRNVYEAIDWRPYNKIDKLLEDIILQGSIAEKEAETIIKSLENELQRPKVINYILATIKKRGFLPREKNSFEYDSFKNRWMTDEAWAKFEREKTAVEWLGEKAHSLTEMGEISLRKPEDAKYFLRNTNYLVPNVTMLTKSPSKADEFSKIIENEPNIDKRYLTVMYRLNRELPFRLHQHDFASIYALFDKTAIDYTFFISASERYNNGHIHIWLNETDPINADKLTKGFDFNSFLTFLYNINGQHPFYLTTQRFDTPEQLVQQAGTDASLWNKIAAATANGQVPVWLAGMGRQEWLNAYNEQVEKVNTSTFYTDEEKGLATVQSLIQIVDAKALPPHIVSDQKTVQLLAVEGSKTVQHNIYLQLENSGFTKADIFLDTKINGVSLSNNTFTFWSQNNVNAYTLTLTIEALQLTKNKLYSTNIMIDTEFENLVIPVEIKVVFPKKAYITHVLKYALFGAVFFALIRYVTGIITENDSWFAFSEDSYSYPYDLPANYFSYFVGLALLIAGLIGSIFLIRKIEKI